MKKIQTILAIFFFSTAVSVGYAQTVPIAAAPADQSVTAATQPIDINTADQATLQTVKGIGPSRAKAIIDYRNEHGPFKSVDDLLQVKGVSSQFLEKNRGQITVVNK